MLEARKRLRLAVDEHKWHLSEKAGHDVGYDAAVADFLVRHFDRFAQDLRIEFCRIRCTASQGCTLAGFVGSIPSTCETMNVHARVFSQRKAS